MVDGKWGRCHLIQYFGMTARVKASTELRLYIRLLILNYLSCEIDEVRRIDNFCVSYRPRVLCFGYLRLHIKYDSFDPYSEDM